ncbi:TIGR00366 family protein [Bacteroidia bacterium]|nr:TIGR00366 family protein [Bacteroidia bacterium]MDB9883098.1 TIGR00366 family protein [Bacteroidia bacterium]MDC1395515.1 TIGR00366 family protein [Bacteroidia bacterium]
MNFTQKYADWFRHLLPSPFSIAILLTLLTFFISLFVSEKSTSILLLDWQAGLWQSNLLAFAFQMLLMLVLGHALALSTFFDKLISSLVHPIKTTGQAAAIVTISTILVAFLNWGLGLIFGAIIARKIGESFTKNQLPLNYPLIGAAGYVGLMVWHGGLSGSALTKVAENGHIQQIASNSSLPEAIYYGDTVFSAMNMTAFGLLLVLIPVTFYKIGNKSKYAIPAINSVIISDEKNVNLQGAEHIDHLQILSKTIGALLLGLAIFMAVSIDRPALSFITPNFINFTMLALCLLLHKNFSAFLSAIDDAIKGSSAILIQFPLYFGILALMQSGGLIEIISNWFIAISTTKTLPIFTFFSAGVVNVFVPSGGGQWAIQGPIILDAATKLNVPLSKMILALAYGDQLTNMLQPFWALPLLSITGLKAKDILPYTLILLLIGMGVFMGVLLAF